MKFYAEQQKAHDDLVKSRGGLLFWKVGTGKTRVGLEVFATLQQVYKWPNPCICLFVCKPKCFYDIRQETVKIGFDCVVLENDYDEIPEKVWSEMLLRPTILLVSHAMLEKRLAYFDSNKFIKMVIFDDGYLFKNPKAGKTKAANKLTISRRALLMSGSVMTQQDLTDIWGQAYAVNQHRRLAKSLTNFNSEYFNMKMIDREGSRQFPMWSPKKGSYERIVTNLGEAASFYFPKNSDRKIHHQIIEVEASDEQTKMFEELREWFSLKTDGIQLDYALQVSNKLQQISNGWIETGTRNIRLLQNNKLAKLAELVDTILAGSERCIIWCAFREDVKVVAAHLKVATLQMSGDTKFDLEAWQSGKFSVVIATEASGVGFNHFEQVPYAIYFSMGWKWLDLQQSRGRNDRTASLHEEVFYYYLQTRGGLDKKIYNCASQSEQRELTLIKLGEVREWLLQRGK